MAIDNEIFAHYRTENDRLKDAKKILKMYGYYTDNLWHIDDVKNYADDMDDDDAYEVLDRVMQSEYMVSSIFEMIDIEAKVIENENENENE